MWVLVEVHPKVGQETFGVHLTAYPCKFLATEKKESLLKTNLEPSKFME